MSADVRGGGVGGPVLASVALHAAVVAAALLAVRPTPAPVMPPSYRVNLIAAPAGERAIGVVQPPASTPPATAKPDAPPPRPVIETKPTGPTVPAKATKATKPAKPAPPKSTPTAPGATTAKPGPATTAPRAGGGPTGGKGADVANVQTQGIDFPYPGYLENVVRQIALRFHPPRGSQLRADVAFLVHRDGSVSDLRFVSRSGAYGFDLEAQGAVEAAAQARAFGPLPAGFRDDALPVVFSFDPRIIR